MGDDGWGDLAIVGLNPQSSIGGLKIGDKFEHQVFRWRGGWVDMM